MRGHLKDHLFEDLLPIERHVATQRNALLDELRDFAGSIQEHREPLVTGEQGRNVLAVAEQIINAIGQHRWDGEFGNRVGPLGRADAPHPPRPALAQILRRTPAPRSGLILFAIAPGVIDTALQRAALTKRSRFPPRASTALETISKCPCATRILGKTSAADLQMGNLWACRRLPFGPGSPAVFPSKS